MATLEQLVGMGFPEEDVKNAMQAHGSAALDVLLGRTLESASREVSDIDCRSSRLGREDQGVVVCFSVQKGGAVHVQYEFSVTHCVCRPAGHPHHGGTNVAAVDSDKGKGTVKPRDI